MFDGGAPRLARTLIRPCRGHRSGRRRARTVRKRRTHDAEIPLESSFLVVDRRRDDIDVNLVSFLREPRLSVTNCSLVRASLREEPAGFIPKLRSIRNKKRVDVLTLRELPRESEEPFCTGVPNNHNAVPIENSDCVPRLVDETAEIDSFKPRSQFAA